MKFDLVFDVQCAYRSVLKAMSYPGEIVSLAQESARIELDMQCYRASIVLMYTLLDADTSFHVESSDQHIASAFAQMTYSKEESLEHSSFIFVTASSTKSLDSIIKQAYEGSLEDPHRSATILVECDHIDTKAMYELTGCGIKDKTMLRIEHKHAWLDARADKNIEFPLGVDMLFVDKQANLVAIPRTTKIKRCQSWPM